MVSTRMQGRSSVATAARAVPGRRALALEMVRGDPRSSARSFEIVRDRWRSLEIVGDGQRRSTANSEVISEVISEIIGARTWPTST